MDAPCTFAGEADPKLPILCLRLEDLDDDPNLQECQPQHVRGGRDSSSDRNCSSAICRRPTAKESTGLFGNCCSSWLLTCRTPDLEEFSAAPDRTVARPMACQYVPSSMSPYISAAVWHCVTSTHGDVVRVQWVNVPLQSLRSSGPGWSYVTLFSSGVPPTAYRHKGPKGERCSMAVWHSPLHGARMGVGRPHEEDQTGLGDLVLEVHHGEQHVDR